MSDPIRDVIRKIMEAAPQKKVEPPQEVPVAAWYRLIFAVGLITFGGGFEACLLLMMYYRRMDIGEGLFLSLIPIAAAGAGWYALNDKGLLK